MDDTKYEIRIAVNRKIGSIYLHYVTIGIKDDSTYEFILGNGSEWTLPFTFDYKNGPFHAYIVNDLDPNNVKAQQILKRIIEHAKNSKGMKSIIDLSTTKETNPLSSQSFCNFLQPALKLVTYQVNCVNYRICRSITAISHLFLHIY